MTTKPSTILGLSEERNKHGLMPRTYPVGSGRSAPIHSISRGSIDDARSAAVDAILARHGLSGFVGKLGTADVDIQPGETEQLIPENYPAHALRPRSAKTKWKERRKV